MSEAPVATTGAGAKLPDWTLPEPSSPFVTGLRVNNSLTGGKVAFIPAEGNLVRWYGCGPTVYDSAHMGHARNYVSFDVLRRIMEDYFGYKVVMCMNITDIDDKIISRALEQGIPFDQLSRFWENDFFNQMKKLKCKLPDVITRVSEYVPEILAFTEKMIANGYAYVSQGSVYFDIQAFRASGKHHYGRMEPWSVNDEARVLEGEGALGIVSEKKNPLDFALWKKAKENEPSWESPWGPGRPGWHIECSVMASDVLGFPLDIHSGGIDLRFPHHDNELAQTEACFDRPGWVNYFLHSGHLHIQGLKMSKSLKNFITIDAILEKYNPRIVRILTLIHKWDQPMNYDAEGSTMAESIELDRVFTHFFENTTQLLRKALKTSVEFADPTAIDMDNLTGLNAPQKWTDKEKEIQEQWEAAQAAIHEALCDNFNTPVAMSKLQELITMINNYVKRDDFRGPLVGKVAQYVYDMLKIFGVAGGNEDYQFSYSAAEVVSDERFNDLMDVTAEFRHEVRELSKQLLQEKDAAATATLAKRLLELSDLLRDEKLIQVGVRLEDKGVKGYIWKQSNREELLAERLRKQREEAEKKEAKKYLSAAVAADKSKREAELLIAPEQYFRETRGTEFAEYDEQGIPTHLAGGEPVSKTQRSKMQKLLEKHRELHAKATGAAKPQGGKTVDM